MFSRVYQSASVLLRHSVQHLPLRGERFILAHGFRTFSPWLAGSQAEMLWQKGLVANCLPHGSLEAERGVEVGDKNTDTLPARMNSTAVNFSEDQTLISGASP